MFLLIISCNNGILYEKECFNGNASSVNCAVDALHRVYGYDGGIRKVVLFHMSLFVLSITTKSCRFLLVDWSIP